MPQNLPSIDFRRIRSKPPRGTQADGFEELYSQLLIAGELAEFPAGTRFERFGNPDGGREGRAILPDGQVWCWQAKYQWSFDSAADVNASYERALELEPDMTRYLVGMPIDLAAGDGPGRKSAQTKWNEWVAVKQADMPDGRTMRFEFRGEGAFNLALLRPRNVGYLRYWFDGDALTQGDFERLLERARIVAGPRYTAELNVEVPEAAAIRAYSGDRSALDSMSEALGDLDRYVGHLAAANDGEITRASRVDPEHLGGVAEELWSLTYTARQSIAAASVGERPPAFDREIESARNAVRAVSRALREVGDSDGGAPTYQLERRVEKIRGAVDRIELEYRSAPWRAMGWRSLLVTGVGGAGKTHLLVDVLRNHVEAQHPGLLFFGEQIDAGPIENELARLVGFTGPPQDLLPTLDAAGEAAGDVALIVIDGLNESRDRSIWATYLEGFFSAASAYEHLRVIVSCRSEYLDDTVAAGARDRVFELEHHGFAHFAAAAVGAFADWYGLDQPTFPLLVPEFTNPLLLKLACEAVKDSGDRAFPRVASGLTWLTGLIIDAVDKRLSHPSRCDYMFGRHLLRQLCEWLAKRSVEGERSVPIVDIADESDRLLPQRDWSRSLLAGALHEGVLTKFGRGGEEFVRFAYERVGDVLAATQIALQSSEEIAERVRQLSLDWHHFAGLLDALSVVLPERRGVELIELLGRETAGAAVDSFYSSLQWRSAESVSVRTVDMLGRLREAQGFSEGAWDALLALAPLEGFPLNADYLHAELRKLTLPARDSTWTLHINGGSDGADLIGRLTSWAWGPASVSTSDEVVRLTGLVLGWALSSSRRSTRDNVTKSLVALIEHHPTIARPLLEAFAGIDDPYIEERLFAASYGAAARVRDPRSRGAIADALAGVTLDVDYWPVHLLTRHYARRVFELAAELGWRHGAVSVLAAARPPYMSKLPVRQLSSQQIKEMNVAPDYVYSTVGHSLLSDFGDFRKYVINHPVGSLQLPDGIDAQYFSELIFEWVIDLGWTPDRFQRYDTSRRAALDSRDDRVERIGKKYQWIAYWQLLGLFTDHFQLKDRYTDVVRGYEEPIDVDVPDIDPTVLVRPQSHVPIHRKDPIWFAPVGGDMPKEDQEGWLLNDEYVPNPADLIEVTDHDGGTWTLLEGYYSWEQHKPSLEAGETRNPRHVIWMQIRSYIVANADRPQIEAWAMGQDWYGRWMPESGDPYGLYLADHPDSVRWIEASRDDHDSGATPVPVEVTTTSYGGMGGSWDYSDSKEVRGLLPSSAVCERLGLGWSGDFRWSGDGTDTIAANFGSAAQEGPNAVFVDRTALAAALSKRGEALLVTVLAEKGTYRDNYEVPNGTPFSRSYSASFVIEDGDLRAIHGVARLHLAGTGQSSEPEQWSPHTIEP